MNNENFYEKIIDVDAKAIKKNSNVAKYAAYAALACAGAAAIVIPVIVGILDFTSLILLLIPFLSLLTWVISMVISALNMVVPFLYVGAVGCGIFAIITAAKAKKQSELLPDDVNSEIVKKEAKGAKTISLVAVIVSAVVFVGWIAKQVITTILSAVLLITVFGFYIMMILSMLNM